MSKTNTLFSYFSKSPKAGSTSQSTPKSNHTPSSKEDREGSISLKSGASFNKKIKGSKEIKHGNLKSPLQSTQDTEPECEYKLHDTVWAKVEGYPYWPALVCTSPRNESSFVRGKKKKTEVHVQFFDQPPSRAWIGVKFVKGMSGPRHPEITSLKDDAWKAGVEQACKAMEMSRDDRASLIVQQLESNQEDNNVSDDPSDTENDYRLSSNKKRRLEGSLTKKPKKRRLQVLSDSDSEDEYKPNANEAVSSEDEEDMSIHETDDEPSPVKTPKTKVKAKSAKVAFPSLKKTPETSSPLQTPKTKVKAKSAKVAFPSLKKTPETSSPLQVSTKSKLLSFSFSEEGGQSSGSGKVWTHLKLDWLKPEHIKDINGNPKGHPDYDSRTLFVPNSFKQGLTPAIRQWWEMKSKYFDTILFFKVGKFYELYHMDAVTGINELNLREMSGDHAHSGFPEISYGRYSSMLIQKGYKVARVEQTETPQMMEERCKQMNRPTKFDKVVNREICAVTTKGTCTFGVQDGEAMTAGSNFLLSLAEKEMSSGDSIYGVCFVDTSIGKFYLGQFSDDRHCSRLRTLIAHFPPAQVLYERNHSSKKTQTILNGCLTSAMKETLSSGKEFWDVSKTLKTLAERTYFKDDSDDCKWPELLIKMIDDDDPLKQKAHAQYEFAVKALGACTWYLHKSLIDEELLSMKNFEEYVPPDDSTKEQVVSSLSRQHMVLDGITLRNLEVLENSLGSAEGSLLDALECCHTPFGKRLFRQWICSPLCNPDNINDRLNGIEDLENIQSTLEDVSKKLKKLPDLQRLLNRIHAQGSFHRSENHPDSRAVFYEENVYSKRKIADFVSCLQAFKLAQEINHLVNDSKCQFSSKLLKNVVLKSDEGGLFPHLKKLLQFFDNAFDHEEAKKLGKIIPSKGVDEDFDSAEKNTAECKKRLDEYLEKQKRHFGCKVTYFNSGKSRFQLEVPEHACKNASKSHELVSQKKGFKRFWTSEIKAELAKLVSAEERRETALKDIMRRLFYQFDKHYKKWECAVDCLAVLDCLLSLVYYKLNSQVTMCRPIIVLPNSNNGASYMKIKDGCHPALIKRLSGGDFIPNDITIGSQESNDCSKLSLVTGPNMGGKSTLMRQAGLLTIMAQMGSYVPAEEFELTPVDRVFTRLGASDRILEGESTFFVELSETGSILKHATEHSLVLLDELGRGTATYDGTAIAFAVAQDLASRLRCRCLFSTHYHTLVDHFSKNPHVRLGHMSCMVENENQEDPTQETITFLYKFVEGACPKSYGFNAARLAGIPDTIIRSGFLKAKEFEQKSNRMKILRQLFNSSKTEIGVLIKETQKKLTLL